MDWRTWTRRLITLPFRVVLALLGFEDPEAEAQKKASAASVTLASARPSPVEGSVDFRQTLDKLERRGGVARVGAFQGPGMTVVLAAAHRGSSVIEAGIGKPGVAIAGDQLRSLG